MFLRPSFGKLPDCPLVSSYAHKGTEIECFGSSINRVGKDVLESKRENQGDLLFVMLCHCKKSGSEPCSDSGS